MQWFSGDLLTVVKAVSLPNRGLPVTDINVGTILGELSGSWKRDRKTKMLAVFLKQRYITSIQTQEQKHVKKRMDFLVWWGCVSRAVGKQIISSPVTAMKYLDLKKKATVGWTGEKQPYNCDICLFFNWTNLRFLFTGRLKQIYSIFIEYWYIYFERSLGFGLC